MTTSIFHSGDLQSGIALAIQQQKLVAVLVRADGDAESARWESEWLQGDASSSSSTTSNLPLGRSLASRAVVLRIDAGSREAAFLAAFCPVAAVPALALIRDGVVLEKIERGVGEQEFVSRLVQAAGLEPREVGDEDEGTKGETLGEAVEEDARPEPDPATAAVVPPPSNPSAPATSAPVREMLDERATRLQAERKRREELERAAQAARSQARRREAEEASAAAAAAAATTPRDKGKGRAAPEQSEQQKAREAWIYQQKQRKDEAKKERERILARIEADKQERRSRALMAKEAAVATSGGDSAGAFSELHSADRASKAPRPGESCSLQVRLFDGSSIRGKFASDADIATAVRPWIAQSSSAGGGADQPYTLRQILAPQPSRSIEVSEEHQSLAELGLAPTATLVLVPVAQYSDAYAGAGGGGYVGAALQAAYGVANSGFGLLGSVASYIPGFGGAAAADESRQRSYARRGPDRSGTTGDEQDSSTGHVASGPSIRVKTLADQRADAAKKQGNEFYNGNSLRFEGRDDEDADDG